ncbi:MAG: lytic transglycosylase domain-containing protein, partial [Saprospiraceae bacterium]|nr:lytic transglycosylase domain-containing protein [Saprospiraceae bacterium]
MRSGALLWFSGCVALLLAAALFTSSSDRQGASLSVATGATDGLPQQIHSVELGKHYSFAGEELPMKNFDVRERLDREFLVNSYYHSNTLLSIKMAYRHFPAIEKILAEEGLPDDLKYLAVAESSLLNAGSHAGAEGVWQF